MLSLHQDFKITDLNGTLNAFEINAKLDAVSQILAGINFKVMGVLMDNTIDWVILDLYAHRQNKTFVPIPSFFTAQQKQFLIEKAKVDLFISHDQNLNASIGFDNDYFFLDDMVISNKANLLAKNQSNFQKISFTSGTTSEPKGVELSSEGQWEVAKGLLNQLQDLNLRKHMSLLPFGVLLENIGGVYTMTQSGGELIVLPTMEVGLLGSSQFDVDQCFEALIKHKPESIILLPNMLEAMVNYLHLHPRDTSFLKFIAVGGAKTPKNLLEDAENLGLPVYEGYGLTECYSVVTVNSPKQKLIGSVGQALPNRNIRINDQKEIEIEIKYPFKYLDRKQHEAGWFKTGDLGFFQNGCLVIEGRSKNILITSFGRNVSPEWPESLLNEHPEIYQSCVTCFDQSFLSAIIVPYDNSLSFVDLEELIILTNTKLPDYAQIKSYVICPQPFSFEDQTLTINGRLKRDNILRKFQDQQFNHIEEREIA